jgi:bifunctional non-homologous end joining protein LigD
MMVFDLDPGPPANIVQCAQVGMWLREVFEHFGLRSFPKTSGSKGLQIYVPLNTPTRYEDTKPFAHALARLLEDQHRDLVVSDMKKELRKGKVLVDWSQNDEHKTTIAVYSLRAREHPTVSTPVKWEEVEQLLKKKEPGLLVFEAGQVLKRVEKMGDLFEPTVKLKQKLPKLASDVGASPSTSLRAGSARAASEARGISAAAGDGLKIAAQAGSKKKTANRTGKKAVSGKKARKI